MPMRRFSPDTLILEQVLRYLNNWFVVPNGVFRGAVALTASGFEPPFDSPAKYFRIIGSAGNDGIAARGQRLDPETFTGEVWALAIPEAVLSIACEIGEWQKKYGIAAASPFTSESFGGYSYSKAAQGNSSSTASWQRAFVIDLRPWRKL